MSAELLMTSALLGVGLAMDAFSVSVANGLADSTMNKWRMLSIAGTYAGFQFIMPVAGWFLVTRAAEKFEWFRPMIPWIALALLLMIGVGLLKDGISELNEKKHAVADSSAETAGAMTDEAVVCEGADGTDGVKESETVRLTFTALMIQGVATSIDALSVGFTTASYDTAQALMSSLIIGLVTLAICMAGLRIGRKLGDLLAGRAPILGAIILICIGLEIWIKGVFL